MAKYNPDFVIGNIFEYAGCKYRVLAGNRAHGDSVIEFQPPTSGWWRPPIAHGLILYEFKCGVEDNNYPYPLQGRHKLQLAYAGSLVRGWRQAAIEIEGDVRRRGLENK